MLPATPIKSSPLDKILQAVPQLSQSEKLELIVYLAQDAKQTAVPATTHYWRDIAGIAPNLLEGHDAQEWVNQARQEPC
jgi:pyoverdine/dityrosine biosynthesis protein Dit1